MQRLTRVLGTTLLAVLIAQPAGVLPALAQGAAASVATGVLKGTITDGSGTPIAGATVILSGPATARTVTDAGGHYSITTVPGVYKVVVRAGGFGDSVDDGVTVSSASTLDATLVRPTLSSLQTIGTVRSAGGSVGPQFNASAASSATIGHSTFEDQGDLSVRNILDETPGIVDSVSNGSANGGVRGAITYPTIRGGLSYETASLIDGHPVSVGKYGDYVSTFLNPFMFQSIEVQKGPGSTPPQIARSVNGTVNFRTWDPTSAPAGNVEIGTDLFGGKFANARFTDTVLNGKLGFVVAFATEGTPGSGGSNNDSSFAAALSGFTYTDSHGVPVSVSPVTQIKAPGATNSYTSLATNTIACCVSMPTWYSNRSELVKLRYNFSSVTSFTATMLASQSYASQNGNNQNLYPTAFAPTTANATLTNSKYNVYYPFGDNFAQDYEFNNEPIFEGEFHSQIGNDTLLMRYYSASIGRMQTNGDQTNAPITQNVNLYGQTSTGVPLNGLDAYGNPFIATITNPLYQSNEQDNLTGYTFEYDHALGNSGSIITFSADQNYSTTHVYTPGSPDTSSTSNIPLGSQQNVGTYRVLGNFQIGSKLNVVAAYYVSRFDTHYPMFGTANAISFGDNILWHGDERLGLAYRLAPSTSIRFSAGSALVPPFLGILSGSAGTPALCTSSTCPVGYQPGSVLVNTVGGVNVRPETSFGYDLGADYKFRNPDMSLSGDIYSTTLQNQFLRTIYANGTAIDPVSGHVFPLFTTAYSNLSDARYEGVELRITDTARRGFGYGIQGALIRGYPYNVPQSIYQINAAGVATTNQSVVPYVNFGPTSLLASGGSAIPYAQGYAEVNYRMPRGWYGNIGMLYLGHNNTYNEPAFEVVRATIRAPLFNPQTYLQLAVDNLFQAAPYAFDVFGAGVQSPAIGGQFVATTLKGYGPRNIHLVLVHNFK